MQKFAIIFLVLASTALLVALDYQHQWRGSSSANAPSNKPLQPLLDASKPVQLTLEPVNLALPAASLSDYKGRFVLINAWASWCPPCVAEFPHLIQLAEAYPENLQLVTLSADRTREAAQDFLKQFPERANAFHAFDAAGKSAREVLQIYRYPESLLLNEEGILLKKYVGILQEADLAQIRQYLQQAKTPAAK